MCKQLAQGSTQWNSGVTRDSNRGRRVLIPSALTTRPPSHQLQTASKLSVLCCHLANTNDELGGVATAIPPFTKLLWSLLYVAYSPASEQTDADDEFVTFDDDISVKMPPNSITSLLHGFTGEICCCGVSMISIMQVQPVIQI